MIDIDFSVPWPRKTDVDHQWASAFRAVKDNKGRARQVQFTEKLKNLPATNGAKPNPVTVNATAMFSDFGAPVDIAVPAKAQTTDITNRLPH